MIGTCAFCQKFGPVFQCSNRACGFIYCANCATMILMCPRCGSMGSGGSQLLPWGAGQPAQPKPAEPQRPSTPTPTPVPTIAPMPKPVPQGPGCPHCGGALPANATEKLFRVCMHCRNPLFWFASEVYGTEQEAHARAEAQKAREERQAREEVERLASRASELLRTIEQAVAAGRMDDLLTPVNAYLKLKPDDGTIVALRQSLLEQEKKQRDEIASRLSDAKQLLQTCQYQEAATLATAIPESRRPRDVEAFLSQCRNLQSLREAALSALRQADERATDHAIEAAHAYRDAIQTQQIVDREFTKLLSAAEQQREADKVHERLLSRKRMRWAAITLAIGLAATGVWLRSTMRANALQMALTQGRWDKALTLDPRNVPALLGRARGRLTASPPDVAAALVDIEAAERLAPGSSDIKATRAAAIAVRAAVWAGKDNLADAAKDLEEAHTMGADDAALAAAKEAILTAWLARAEAAVATKDVKKFKQSLDGAAKRGASGEQLERLRVHGPMLEAMALVAKGNAAAAAAKFSEATALNAAVAKGALDQPDYVALRRAVMATYRAQFDGAVERKDVNKAVSVAAAAERIDPDAWKWVSTLPPAMIAALPAARIAELPQAAFAVLPPIRNSIGIELKLLPHGTFTMGDAGGSDSWPHHPVTLSRPFYMSVYEVTNAQWKQVMGRSPSSNQDDAHPAEQVTWVEAVEFCRKLSALPEERKAGRNYRLPTEAEWEYACRAGTTAHYSYSLNDDMSRLGEHAWYSDNSGGHSHPVGQKKPNPWGLYDMHGNVSEWCQDWYGEYRQDSVTDPEGPSTSRYRVHRGGGWSKSDWDCGSPKRDSSKPDYNFFTIGFRLALSPPGSGAPKAEKE